MTRSKSLSSLIDSAQQSFSETAKKFTQLPRNYAVHNKLHKKRNTRKNEELLKIKQKWAIRIIKSFLFPSFFVLCNFLNFFLIFQLNHKIRLNCSWNLKKYSIKFFCYRIEKFHYFLLAYLIKRLVFHLLSFLNFILWNTCLKKIFKFK